MKYTLLLFIVTTFSYGVAYSQTKAPNDTTETSDTDQILSELDEINDRLGRLEEAADKEKVVYLKIISWDGIDFNRSDCSDKKQNQSEDLKSMPDIDIDMISLIIKDGSFLEVQIFTIDNNGIERVFTNPKAPIGISSRNIFRGDKLTYKRRKKDCFNLFTNDIWQFRFLNSFVPEDTTFTLTKEEYEEEAYAENGNHIGIPLHRGVNINSLFDVAVFTDALSLLGNESNGLLVTDFRFNQVLHQRNRWDSSFYIFRDLSFRLRLTKFDDEFSTIAYNENRNATIFQQSWLRSEIGLSILNFPIAFKSLSSGAWYVNSGVFLTEIFDSEQNSESNTITSTFIATGIKIDFLFASNSGLLFDVSGGRHFTPNVSNMDFSWFGESSTEIFWNPLGNDSGRLFGKVAYMIDEHSNDFFQLNFGYRVMLSKLIATQ